MMNFRSPNRLKRPAPVGARRAPAPRQPADLSAVLDFLPRGAAPRLDPAAAREALAHLLRVMEACFLPQPASTLENHFRCQHQDLPGLSDQELWQEVGRAGFLLAWTERAQWHPWVLERSERCQQEMARRREGGRHARQTR